MCCGTEVSHSAEVLGVTLNLGQKSRNTGDWVYLPYIKYIKFWMATHWPEMRGGLVSLAALGRLFAGFGPTEQSLLVRWSSHRLLARPAQNPVSCDFLCSCIIFPCLLNGWPRCGGSSLTLLDGEEDVEGRRGYSDSPTGALGWESGDGRGRAPHLIWWKI